IQLKSIVLKPDVHYSYMIETIYCLLQQYNVTLLDLKRTKFQGRDQALYSDDDQYQLIGCRRVIT
ncbi:MAG: hypothetical protein MUP62_02550, partial [Dehalococcoidia bacterium]|nr:hypothetical protein [Dehalococcoidia bacterium]